MTENPDDVTGCADCLELAAEDLPYNNEYGGSCLHCDIGLEPRSSGSWLSARNRISEPAVFSCAISYWVLGMIRRESPW